jgi:MFS family permease
MAPEDMRGRYMGIYTVTTAVGSGVGPLIGGFLSDNYGPVTTWYGGGLAGFIGAGAFILDLLVQRRRENKLVSVQE